MPQAQMLEGWERAKNGSGSCHKNVKAVDDDHLSVFISIFMGHLCSGQLFPFICHIHLIGGQKGGGC